MSKSLGMDFIRIFQDEVHALANKHVDEQPEHLDNLEALIAVARLKLQ